MGLAIMPTKLGLIAQRLEGDIRARGLRPGDRYLTVSEAAAMLDVSPASAHRAMDMLVSKKLLSRQQGRGTFIADGIGRVKPPSVRTVFIMMPEDVQGVSSVQLDVMVDAVRNRFGSVNVQFSFVPRENPIEFVKEVVGMAQRTSQYAGVIPISCSREVYRTLSELGGPLVVLGSLFRDQWNLPSVDVDYREVGRLLCRHLVDQGHKRLALLAPGEGRPGDHAFFDGVSDVLTEEGLPHNALTVRIFPRDFESFRAQVVELLDHPDRPTGLICANERLVGVVLAVTKQLNLKSPKDFELAFHSQGTPGSESAAFVHVQPKLPFRQIADRVAEMLKQIADGKPVSEQHVLFDVELHDPAAKAKG